MPLFEYKCNDCNTVFEILHKSSEKRDDIFCPKCKSANSEKLISVFSSLNSSKSGFPGCSDGSCGMNPYGGCENGMCGMN